MPILFSERLSVFVNESLTQDTSKVAIIPSKWSVDASGLRLCCYRCSCAREHCAVDWFKPRYHFALTRRSRNQTGFMAMMAHGPGTAGRALCDSDCRCVELLGTGADLRNLAGDLLRRGMTSYLYERKERISNMRGLPNRCATGCGRTRSGWRPKPPWKSSSSVSAISARKTGCKRRWCGDQPGLVCIFSAMEPCSTYKPWHDKSTERTFLKSDDGKCLHYYFYFIDAELGLC